MLRTSRATNPAFATPIRIALLVLACIAAHTAAKLEPIRASYDAIPGRPLVIAVRPDDDRRPPDKATLRFPDGQEIHGEVAAVRLTPPEADTRGWLDPGQKWTVLSPRDADPRAETLAWFVLAELPEGVIGQEVWLDGQPITLRWLPRPALLARRLGFDTNSADTSPLADPWASPLPETWRDRPDLAATLAVAFEDPLRRWRALLATRGLRPNVDVGIGPITPDLLGSGLVEASARVSPLAERLIDAVAEQSEARWRIALARLWAADPGLSLRARHALAGAGLFPIDGATNETAVAPVWPATDRDAGVLLEALLDDSAGPTERASRAQSWLDDLPEVALWPIADGVRGGSARIGAMFLNAGDTTAFADAPGGGVTRPDLLLTRCAATLRPAVPQPDERGVSQIPLRIAGKDHQVPLVPGPIPLTPPGATVGPVFADYSMAAWLDADTARRIATLASDRVSGLLSRTPGDGQTAQWHLFLRFLGTSTDKARLWIGPSGRARGVVTIGADGSLDLQRFDRSGAPLGDPSPVATAGDGPDARVELILPSGSIEPDGTLHLALECVDATGNRWAWPRPMLPWQIEPARRVLDTTAWMGGLQP